MSPHTVDLARVLILAADDLKFLAGPNNGPAWQLAVDRYEAARAALVVAISPVTLDPTPRITGGMKKLPRPGGTLGQFKARRAPTG